MSFFSIRQTWAAALLALAGAAVADDADGGSKPGPLAEQAGRFAESVRRDVVALLFTAAAIDPDTRAELKQQRAQRLRRQRELRKWFVAKGRNVAWEDCATETDRANFAGFPTAMATRELLALPLRDRRRLLRTTEGYFAEFAGRFPGSIETLLPPGDSSFSPALPRTLQAQLSRPPRFEARFFGREAGSETSALYIPANRTVYLNLNRLAESDLPAFLDSFEHELWHHLLPAVAPPAVSRNIWWEGFNEAIAETWACEFHRGAKPLRDLNDESIEYPIQTAFATLFLGADRSLTLAHLAGAISRAEFAKTLGRPDTGSPAKGAAAARLRSALATGLLHAETLDRGKQRRVEDLLAIWGWKEDDGARVSISYLITDGRLASHVVDREFRSNRQFLMAVIKAVTTAALQDLCAALPPRDIRNSLQLPAPLARNLRRVLRHVQDPTSELQSR